MNRSSAAASFAGALLFLAPAVVLAEGAIRHLDCAFTRVCDAAGSCAAEAGEVSFSLAPLSTGPDGSGRFEIRYGSVRAPMQALSDAGPFHWKVGDEQNTLLVSSDTGLVWHRLKPGATPSATLRFLRCRYRQ